MSVLTLEAKLEREHGSTSWGFRLGGGKDFSAPLTIQKVDPGSLAAKCGLQVGDIILRIGATATENLRHKEAKETIMGAGNKLDLLLQRGGSGGYDRFNGPTINTNWNASTPAPAAAPSPSQNFNNAPRPFGSQAPTPQMQNLSISSAKDTPSFQRPNPPAFQSVTPQKVASPSVSKEPLQKVSEKYADQDDSAEILPQSKSFKYLQNLMDTGKELNNALKPVNTPTAFSKPPEPQGAPSPNPLAAPIGPGSKPGTVKAIVSQRYNNPLGLYSKDNASTQLEGQSKFLMDKDDAASGTGAPAPAPAPAYNAAPAPAPASAYKPPAPAPAPVAAKPWTPAPAPPPAPAVTNASPRPFGAPKPSGQGAIRGKKGDASMNPAALPAGRIPVCAACNQPIRGPFVTALGKCWCPNCFVCANAQCACKLLDIGFVEEGGLLYCERDYAEFFAPHCDKCGKAVIGECVNALQKSFCPSCFLCAHCNSPIGGTKFHIEDGSFYCERDWAVMFQTMCAGCDFPIEPGDRWVEAMTKNFHSECFNCSACQVNLEGQQFCAKAGKPFCKKHAR